jgi:hypothetical protein
MFTEKNTPALFAHKKKNIFTKMKGGSRSYDGMYRVVDATKSDDLVQHHYKKNGIQVHITGSYNDVYTIVDILNKINPVKKTDFTTFFGNNHISSTDNNLMSHDSDMTIQYKPRDDKHIIVTIDGKDFSGSGILLIGKNESGSDTDDYFILFKSAFTNKYDDLGGKIDKKFISRDALLQNAQKEAREESIDIFDINVPTDIFIDIKSSISNTYYRIYIYKLKVISDNIHELIEIYNEKLSDTDWDGREGYNETNGISLFNCNKFKTRTMRRYDFDYLSNGVFLNYNDDYVNVNGRCMSAIRKLFNARNLLSSLVPIKIRVDPSLKSVTLL